MVNRNGEITLRVVRQLPAEAVDGTKSIKPRVPVKRAATFEGYGFSLDTCTRATICM